MAALKQSTPPSHRLPRCLCPPRERLNTLEKKLRIFRDLDASKAEERVSGERAARTDYALMPHSRR